MTAGRANQVLPIRPRLPAAIVPRDPGRERPIPGCRIAPFGAAPAGCVSDAPLHARDRSAELRVGPGCPKAAVRSYSGVRILTLPPAVFWMVWATVAIQATCRQVSNASDLARLAVDAAD